MQIFEVKEGIRIEYTNLGEKNVIQNKLLNLKKYWISYQDLCFMCGCQTLTSRYNYQHGWTKNEIDNAKVGFNDTLYVLLPPPHTMNGDKIDDSGKRISYGEGMAVREPADEKGRFDLVSPFALSRLAKWYELGAKKYSDRNWEKGIPFSRYFDSAMRHLNKYIMGMKDEDHLAAAAWNVFAMMHHEERGEDEKLNDLPQYLFKETRKLYDEKCLEQRIDPKETSSWAYDPVNKLQHGCKGGDPYEIV